jgi:hypothetical protein
MKAGYLLMGGWRRRTGGSRAGGGAQQPKPDRAIAFIGAQIYIIRRWKIENENSGLILSDKSDGTQLLYEHGNN